MNEKLKRIVLWFGVALVMCGIADTRISAGKEAIAAPPSSDFYKFYISARRADEGQSIYWVIPPKIKPGDPCHPDSVRETGQPKGFVEDKLTLGGPIPCLAPNLNPPLFMVLAKPVAALPYAEAWIIWAAMSSACTVASIWLISGTFVLNRSDQALLAAWLIALMLLYYPHFIDFTLGQVGSLLLLPLTLTWLSLRRGQDAQAGVWLGIAAGLKPFLLVLAIFVVAQKRWRALSWFTATLIVSLLPGLLWFGWETHLHYREVASHVTWTASNWNASIPGLWNRAFSGLDLSHRPDITAAKTTLSALTCLIVTLPTFFLCARARRLRATDRSDHLVMLALPATLLISPLAWLYYLPWLCIPVAALWHLSKPHETRRAMRLALTASLIATVLPVLMKPIPTPRNPTIWWEGDSLYFYSLIGAWMTLTICSATVMRAERGLFTRELRDIPLAASGGRKSPSAS